LAKIDKKQKIWWFAFVKNVIIIFVKRFRKKEEISMHKYGPVIKMLSLVTQIGITMLTSVFLCMAIGMWIDKHISSFSDSWYYGRNQRSIFSDSQYTGTGRYGG